MTGVRGNKSFLTQCGTPYPDSFCCPTNSTCLDLSPKVFTTSSTSSTGAFNFTVICCPEGSTCDTVAPTSCDTSQYNATLHPEFEVHVDPGHGFFNVYKCGGQECCPPGYICNGDVCLREDLADSVGVSVSASASSSSSTFDLAALSKILTVSFSLFSGATFGTGSIQSPGTSTSADTQTSLSTLISSTTTTLSTSSASSPGAAGAGDLAIQSSEKQASRPNVTVIALGSVMGGLFLIILVALGLFYGRKLRRNRKGPQSREWLKAELDASQAQEAKATREVQEMSARLSVKELPVYPVEMSAVRYSRNSWI